VFALEAVDRVPHIPRVKQDGARWWRCMTSSSNVCKTLKAIRSANALLDFGVGGRVELNGLARPL
jgi:hypothetical protein